MEEEFKMRICKILGHKYVGIIKTRVDCFTTHTVTIPVPRCKRCGKLINEK